MEREDFKGNDVVQSQCGDKSKSKSLPQYGKKGHKPRKPANQRGSLDMDSIHTNDIAYWNKTANYHNVTKFNWDLMLGFGKSLDKATYKGVLNNRSLNTPTICALNIAMGPGYATNVNDGVNRSLAMIMARIRATLSTASIGFETADLGIYLASTSSIAAMIGFAKRILESYKLWMDRNYAYPRGLIKAQGFQYEDIRDNINTYTAILNGLIDMYNNMSIPDICDVYDRQYSMMHSVFVDEDTELGQLYIFNPSNYYTYVDTEFKAKSNPVPVFNQREGEFQKLLDIIETQINSWYTSNDLYQINGVLLRAFKEAPRQVIPYHDMNAIPEPTVDRAFLMQIMNCTIVPGFTATGSDITQNPSNPTYVIWQPLFSTTETVPGLITTPSDYLMNKAVLRLFEDDPTEDDNMELTRLVNLGCGSETVEANDQLYSTMPNCGSEIVTSVKVGYYDSVQDEIYVTPFYSNIAVIESNPTTNIITTTPLDAILNMSNFRYIPCIIVVNWSASANAYVMEGLVGDVYNWMIYPVEDWKSLQNVAYQSIWKPKNI